MRDEDLRAIQQDRLEALQRGGTDAVAALFQRAPAIAELVQDTGPLASWRPSSHNWTLRRLASTLAQPGIIVSLLAHLDRTQHQLIRLAKWRGGTLTREQAESESGLDPDILDNAVAGMADLLLANPEAGWLVPRLGVLDWVHLPGTPFRDGAENILSDDLAKVCRNRGLDPGRLKTERVDTIEASLRDPEAVATTIRLLDPDSREAFTRIIDAPDVDLHDLLYDEEYGPDYHRRYEQRARVLTDLHSYGLVGISNYEQRVWVWLDVKVALRGRLYDEWSRVEPEFVPAPGHPGVGIPTIVGLVTRLLIHMAVNPQPALKSGGIGVNAVKTVAKALGLPTPTAGLALALLIELQLLGTVVTETSGRGRNRRVTEEWRSLRNEEFRSAAPIDRWLSLVSTWAQSIRLPLTDEPLQRHTLSNTSAYAPLARGLLVRAIGDIPDGTAVDRRRFADWFSFRYAGLCTPAMATQLVDQAQVLGLLDGTDQVTPTALVRHWLAGDDLHTVVDAGVAGFVVQADHTIIAPPDLSHALTVRLHQIADLESDHGAHVYRIGDHTLIPALDAGYDADDIVSFLTEHSTVAVPEVVERTIRDAAARHGQLLVGSTTTWLACDDPVLLSNAVGVKRAKLTAISPTAAVSDLPRSKVMAALRAAGVAAVDSTVSSGDDGSEQSAQVWASRSRYPIIDLALDTHALAAALQAGSVEPATQPDPKLWWRDGALDDGLPIDVFDAS